MRKLVLRSEHLTELTTTELTGVVAGAREEPTKTCPDYTYYCITGPAICKSIICP